MHLTVKWPFIAGALDECERNNDVRVIVITGAGKAFSAGQDIMKLLHLKSQEYKKLKKL